MDADESVGTGMGADADAAVLSSESVELLYKLLFTPGAASAVVGTVSTHDLDGFSAGTISNSSADDSHNLSMSQQERDEQQALFFATKEDIVLHFLTSLNLHDYRCVRHAGIEML